MKRRWVRLLQDASVRLAEGMKIFNVFMQTPSADAAQGLKGVRQEIDRFRLDIDAALEAGLPRGAERPGRFGPERELAYDVSRAMNGMIERAVKAAEEMLRLKVESDRFLRDMGRGTVEGCEELRDTLRRLDDPRRAGESVLRAKTLFHRVAESARKAVANILEHPSMVEQLKTKEIYGHFIEIAARGDAAAEAIGDMLVKSAA